MLTQRRRDFFAPFSLKICISATLVRPVFGVFFNAKAQRPQSLISLHLCAFALKICISATLNARCFGSIVFFNTEYYRYAILLYSLRLSTHSSWLKFLLTNQTANSSKVRQESQFPAAPKIHRAAMGRHSPPN